MHTQLMPEGIITGEFWHYPADAEIQDSAAFMDSKVYAFLLLYTMSILFTL